MDTVMSTTKRDVHSSAARALTYRETAPSLRPPHPRPYSLNGFEILETKTSHPYGNRDGYWPQSPVKS